MFSREPAINRLAPGLSIGRRLLASELPAGTQCVVDLTAEFPTATPAVGGRQYFAFPILDGTTPDAGRLRQFIITLPDVPTYVHCAQGHGRTGLFTLVYLLARGNCTTLQQAEELILRERPGVRLNQEQRRFIATYHVGG